MPPAGPPPGGSTMLGAPNEQPATSTSRDHKAPGYIEVIPRAKAGQGRAPVLLQNLEAELIDRLNAATRTASTGMHASRDHQQAANLSLDAHRQVFESFIGGFPTYAPLLQRIKACLDAGVEDGVRCALDNVGLRERLRQSRAMCKASAAAAAAAVMEAEAPALQALHASIAATQRRVQDTQRAADALGKDLSQAKAELERIRIQTKDAKATRARLQDAAVVESEWLGRQGAAALMAIKAGPLNEQEDEELEGELGTAEEQPTSVHPLEQALKLLASSQAGEAAKLVDKHAGAVAAQLQKASRLT